MPVLRFKLGRVEEALRLDLEQALRQMERLKIEAEVTEDGYVEAEVEVDRPDMYSLEGIARQVDGLLGRALGLPRYEVVDSGYRIVAGSVETRPYIVGFAVWNVNVDEDYLPELIQMQEKLTASHGQWRRRVAIGIHDLDKLPSRTLYYKMADIDEVRFKPLGGSRVMSLREVLSGTEQGQRYGGISLAGSAHPVLYSGDEVISVPPVINAELTRVEPGTRNIFVDVTGTELKPVLDIASVLAANLAERSASKTIGVARVEAPWGEAAEPSMRPSRRLLSVSRASSLLGHRLASEEAAELLRRMRFDAHVRDEESLEVVVPRYRVDILHEVDLVEELLLAIGIEGLAPAKPRRMARGSLLLRRFWEREARMILVGYGFVEVKTYTLVPCRDHELVGWSSGLVRLENPVSVEADCFRASLLPSLLRLAARNQHHVPLRVFEVGEALVAARDVAEPGSPPVRQRQLLGVLMMDERIGYEDVQSIVYGLVQLTADEVVEVERLSKPLYIEGRAAKIRTRMGLVAEIGEVNPEILEAMGIAYPVAAAEIEYSGVEGAAVPRPKHPASRTPLGGLPAGLSQTGVTGRRGAHQGGPWAPPRRDCQEAAIKGR